MDYLHKLPFLLGSFMAIVIGVISYTNQTSQQEIYFRMAISMVVFFLIGLYLRSTITNIVDQIEEKKRQEAIEEKTEEMQIITDNQNGNGENGEVTSTLDLTVDDSLESGENLYDEELAPLAVKEFLKSDEL